MADSDGSSGPGYELCPRPHYAWIQNMFRAVSFARTAAGRCPRRSGVLCSAPFCGKRIPWCPRGHVAPAEARFCPVCGAQLDAR